MEVPSRPFLTWRTVLKKSTGQPPHLKLTPNQARALIRTLVALDTIDCPPPASEIDQGGNSPTTIEQLDFPLDAYRHLLAFTEAEREHVRKDLERVLLPINAAGKLAVLLPIDVLAQILRVVGPKSLFRDEGITPQPDNLMDLLPEWRINPTITRIIPSYLLCAELERWLADQNASKNFARAIARRRDAVIQSFNNKGRLQLSDVIAAEAFSLHISPSSEKLRWS